MRRLNDLWFRLRAFFGGNRMDREFTEEAAFHLEMETKNLIRKGVEPAEARRQAQVVFGGVERYRERARDARGTRVLEDLAQDLRFALRTLKKRPLFTTGAILTLGLGIGSSTAMFSVVDGVLLKPLPFEDPQGLVQVWRTRPDRGGEAGWDRYFHSWPDYLRWRETPSILGEMAIYRTHQMTVGGLGLAEEASVGVGSASLFSVLGVSPVLGRAYDSSETGPGAHQVVLLSYEFWQSRFGADSSAVGGSLRLNERPFTIVGVLPRGFRVLRVGGDVREAPQDLWAPVGIVESDLRSGNNAFQALSRLPAEVPILRAQAEVEGLICGERPKSTCGVALVPRIQEETGQASKPVLRLFMASLILLLIGSANLAALEAGELLQRRSEIQTRWAVGAGRSRLARQLLAESALTGLLGSAFGIVLALVGLRLLVGIAPPLPRIHTVGLNGPVLAVGVSLGILSGLLSGAHPILSLLSPAPRGMVDNSPLRVSRGRTAFQRAVITVQVAMAVILLVTGSLLIQSFLNLVAVDAGFRPEGLTLVDVRIRADRFPPSERAQKFARMSEALLAIPGVEAVGATSAPPFSMRGNSWAFEMEDGEPRGEDVPLVARGEAVFPGYFRAMGTTVLAGRSISPSDAAAAPKVVVINEVAATRYWTGSRPAVGSSVTIAGTSFRVVGIVGNIQGQQLRQRPEPTFYVAAHQASVELVGFLVRSSRSSSPSSLELRRAIQSVDPSAPVVRTAPVTDLLTDSLAEERFQGLLVALFSVAGLLLTVTGIWGVTSRDVTQRMREMGVRAAMGADTGTLLKWQMRGILGTGAVGLALGLPLALGTSKFLSAVLFGVTPVDPVTYGSVAIILFSAIGLGGYLPTRRIAALDPARILREG